MKLVDGDWYFFYKGIGEWRRQTGEFLGDSDRLTARQQPAPWNGTGLPPVGTVCEYKRNDVSYRQTWVKVTVKYISLSLVVLEHFAGKNEFVEVKESCVFRPIRTPEQIAADERHEAIKEMRDLSMGRMDIVGAGYLYDAGYRKP